MQEGRRGWYQIHRPRDRYIEFQTERRKTDTPRGRGAAMATAGAGGGGGGGGGGDRCENGCQGRHAESLRRRSLRNDCFLL